MTAIKAAGLESFLRRPDPAVGILLIYGDDPVAVRDVAARAVGQTAGSADDPFAVVRLEDADLAADPARLADEMQSMSMFGGRRTIWVREAGDAFLKAAAPILAGTSAGNLIVAETGNLSRASPLRGALEDSPRALVLPVYEPDGGDISSAIERTLGKAGLAIDNEAKMLLMERVGNSRALALAEVEKLSLFAMGRTRVVLEDVEAVSGDGAEFDGSDLAQAIFTGDIEESDRIFSRMVRAGNDPGRLASLAHQHALRLQDLRLAIDGGTRMDQALRSARPPIFFKRQGSVQRQLAAWPMASLLQAAATLATAVTQARLNAPLAEAIAGRAILSVARNGRALVMALA